MKREQNSSTMPARFILIILSAFLLILILPIVLASLTGQLDLPVEQSYASDTQELTIATEEECLEMIELGAYLEFAETSCVPWTGMQDWIINFDFSFNLIKSLINKKGTDHLLLCSDSGQPSHEFVPGWRSFLKTLLAQGVAFDDIKVMSCDIPKKLTGIK